MHLGGHLRDAFLEFLDSDTPASEFTMEHNGKERSLEWLLGKLWNCTDILPGGYCSHLDLHRGSTYAQAVRSMKNPIVVCDF